MRAFWIGLAVAGAASVVQGCSSGHEDACRPATELCNGRDDDCDGTVDEGCLCTDGVERPCYEGAAGTEGVGHCHGGLQTCTAGAWSTCEGQSLPVPESCNGVDDDCDDDADEEFGVGTACDGPDGDLCAEGVVACDGLGGATCGDATSTNVEICGDGLDQDCDGSDAPCPDRCDTAPLLTAGVPASGTTIAAPDDYVSSCSTAGAPDAVYRIDTSALGARAVLVTVEPADASSTVVSLRSSACTAEVACRSGASRTRVNVPNLPAGVHDVVVEPAYPGAPADHSVRYDLRAADTTFGYWAVGSTGAYEPLPDANALTIPVSTPPLDTITGDEWSLQVGLPFSFPFFGATYGSVYVSSNLFVAFSPLPPDTYFVNECPLSTAAPNAIIAPFWDDGMSIATSKLLTTTIGTAPHRRFVIEFRDWALVSCGASYCYLLDARVSQQVILAEDGEIEFRYGPRTAPTDLRNCSAGTTGTTGQQHLGQCATIGIQDASGTDTDGIQCNSTASQVVEGRVITFVPPT